MAAFAKQFGIKEVADVHFYPVGAVTVAANGDVSATEKPVLVLDTLKVSDIEFTAESVAARGGKGNPKLIVWDYNREATVTLEDATMTMECLEIMYGEIGEDKGNNIITINANKFPGTYAVVGKTWARDIDGIDHVFTFYIPKAKISSESTTISMQAEGDPSVFNMTLEVLRGDAKGDMVQLILNENTDKDTTPTNPPIVWTENTTE